MFSNIQFFFSSLLHSIYSWYSSARSAYTEQTQLSLRMRIHMQYPCWFPWPVICYTQFPIRFFFKEYYKFVWMQWTRYEIISWINNGQQSGSFFSLLLWSVVKWFCILSHSQCEFNNGAVQNWMALTKHIRFLLHFEQNIQLWLFFL